jgi:hypothetical protein
LEEDFADLVIPKAWEQENQKISRVASRLSISPRKVRRVLARLGLLERGEAQTQKADRDVRVDENSRIGQVGPKEIALNANLDAAQPPKSIALHRLSRKQNR